MTRIKKSYCISSCILVAVGLGIFITMNATKPGYELEILQEGDGWAYMVLLEETPVIYQKYMPAIEGNKVFNTKRAAKITGKMVLKKLRNNNSPCLTKSDISRIYN